MNQTQRHNSLSMIPKKIRFCAMAEAIEMVNKIFENCSTRNQKWSTRAHFKGTKKNRVQFYIHKIY